MAMAATSCNRGASDYYSNVGPPPVVNPYLANPVNLPPSPVVPSVYSPPLPVVPSVYSPPLPVVPSGTQPPSQATPTTTPPPGLATPTATPPPKLPPLNPPHIRSVTLSCWLIIMGHCSDDNVVWNDITDARSKNELDLMKILDTKAEEAITKYRDEYITENDIYAMDNYGIRNIKVPIGYWTRGVDDATYQQKTIKYQGKDIKLISATAQLRRLFDWAKKYGMNVIVQLHSHIGCQVMQPGVLCEGDKANWANDPNNAMDSVAWARSIMEEAKNFTAFVGIELMHEPDESISTVFLQNYYNIVINSHPHDDFEFFLPIPTQTIENYDLRQWVDFVKYRQNLMLTAPSYLAWWVEPKSLQEVAGLLLDRASVLYTAYDTLMISGWGMYFTKAIYDTIADDKNKDTAIKQLKQQIFAYSHGRDSYYLFWGSCAARANRIESLYYLYKNDYLAVPP